jgi:predicted aminopeptidase
VIADPKTPPAVRGQLEAVAEIREYASRELKLPDNGSYRSYADVGRPYVVWNVVAAPEFSVDAKQWCYPIVGCVAYRGYFVERRARAFAEKLHRKSLDVSVGGVAAYSTLGHFNDPILNTMLGWDETELASIIFHELTHQMLYVADDSDFNEALATTVEEAGVRRWLQHHGRDRQLSAYDVQQQHYLEVIDLLTRTRTELRTLYASSTDTRLLRDRKTAAYAALRASYAHLKEGWGGRAPFEAWFDGDINNAHLASIATYFDCVPGFKRELDAVGGNLEAFYQRAQELARIDREQRDAMLCGPRTPATPLAQARGSAEQATANAEQATACGALMPRGAAGPRRPGRGSAAHCPRTSRGTGAPRLPSSEASA